MSLFKKFGASSQFSSSSRANYIFHMPFLQRHSTHHGYAYSYTTNVHLCQDHEERTPAFRLFASVIIFAGESTLSFIGYHNYRIVQFYINYPSRQRKAATSIESKRMMNLSTFTELTPFGRLGYASGGGSTHKSPLKYTFCGKAHPSVNENVFLSFRKRISDCTLPSSPACISRSL